MLTALVATLSAALFGGADFLGGFASRRASALTVTVCSQFVGLIVLTAATLVIRPSGDVSGSLVWGVVAGVCGGIGVAALYAGLATGRMSVVAPVTAALSGSIPALVDFARGTQVGPLALAGVALAFLAIVIVSVSGHDDTEGQAWRALGLALVAGLGFSGSILSYAQTPTSSGLAPLVAARITTVLLLGMVTLVAGRSLRLPARAMRPTVFAGALDASAMTALIFALRLGPVAVASVLGALYPVATVLLARFVLHEHIRGWQRVGIALALAAIVLTALP